MIPTARHIPNRPFRSLARWIGLSLLVVFTTLANANGADSGRAKRVVMISTGSRFSPGFALIEQSALDTRRNSAPAESIFTPKISISFASPAKVISGFFATICATNMLTTLPIC